MSYWLLGILIAVVTLANVAIGHAARLRRLERLTRHMTDPGELRNDCNP